MDALMARLVPLLHSSRPAPDGFPGTLFAPRTQEHRTDGDYSATARSFSTYTWLQTNPTARYGLQAGALAGLAAAVGLRKIRSRTRR